MAAGLQQAIGTVFRDYGARWVLGGWSLFTLENILMSEYRTEIKRAWGGKGGPKAYQSLYSTLSAATLGSTCFAYWTFARHSTVLWPRPFVPRVRAMAFLWRAAGLVMLGQLAPPINLAAAPVALGLYKPSGELAPPDWAALGCPFDFSAYKDRGEVYGINRITRRPEIIGLGAIGIGGALLASTAVEFCFFGIGPFVSFSLLALHSDRAQRAGGELSPTKEAQTSALPFIALLDGRQSWSAVREEMVPANAGAAVFIAFLYAIRPYWLRWVR